MEYDYQSLFSVNPKISILLKTWFLKTYYLSNSFLQSQARKCSCTHSLRLYMFRCLDTGLDNSHQCLKKKKRTLSGLTTVRYPYLHGTHNFTRFTCRINWRHSVLFHKALHKGNSFDGNLAEISNAQMIIMYWFAFSFVKSDGTI